MKIYYYFFFLILKNNDWERYKSSKCMLVHRGQRRPYTWKHDSNVNFEINLTIILHIKFFLFCSKKATFKRSKSDIRWLQSSTSITARIHSTNTNNSRLFSARSVDECNQRFNQWNVIARGKISSKFLKWNTSFFFIKFCLTFAAINLFLFPCYSTLLKKEAIRERTEGYDWNRQANVRNPRHFRSIHFNLISSLLIFFSTKALKDWQLISFCEEKFQD